DGGEGPLAPAPAVVAVAGRPGGGPRRGPRLAPPAEESLQEGGPPLAPLRADGEDGRSFREEVAGEVDPDGDAPDPLQDAPQAGGLLLEGAEAVGGGDGAEGVAQVDQGPGPGLGLVEGLEEAQADV